MSETLAQAAAEVRIMLKDVSPSNYAVFTPHMYHALIRVAQSLANKAGVGKTILPNAITSTINSTADVQLPSSVQYHTIHAIRDNSLGVEPAKLTLDEINSRRRGIIPNTTRGRGIPQAFAIWDDEAQATWLRWDTVPVSAIQYDLTRSAVPSTGYTDATVLPFVDTFLRTIETGTALYLASGLGSDVLQRLGLPAPYLIRGKLIPPLNIQQWTQMVQEGVQAEQWRKARVEGRPFGVGAILGL